MSGQISNENLFRTTIEQMHEGIQVVNQDWRYIYMNEAAALHGRVTKEDLVGRTMIECFPGIEDSHMFKVLKAVMRDRTPQQMENYFEFPDGTHCWYQLYFDPHPEGILIRSINITDRKELEEKFIHSQKLEAIGRLAGGVAHDFNNKLGIMTIYSELALKKLDQSDPVHAYVLKTQKAIQQATKLTQQLLAFSRKQVFDLKVVSLNDLLNESQVGLQQLLGEKIRVKVHPAKDLGHVRVDSSQMDQVVLNLCINARDAMPDGGTLTIETQNVELDSAYCKTHPEVIPGNYVMLSVADTGCGIEPALKSKIFEPFFTTKLQGKGTGLGLSMVHGIVNQSKGHIWVYSESNQGSVFKIYLPRIDEPKDQLQDFSLDSTFAQGDEGILLVEDEALLREAFIEALQGAGYKVFAAPDPDAAKKLFKMHQNEISLLVTDVVLPQQNGKEMAKEILTQAPDLKVIYVSGYTENSIVHHSILDTESILIQKPISTRRLLTTVRAALDGLLRKGLV